MTAQRLLINSFIACLWYLTSACSAYAGQTNWIPPFDKCVSIQEEDGTPANNACLTLKVTNGDLTDNGDGTFSLDTAGGGGGSSEWTDAGTVLHGNETTDEICDDASCTDWKLNDAGLIQTSVGLDAIGAVDMDYGSGDVTDHTFDSDGTGTAEFVLKAGAIDSTEILDNTIANADMADNSIDSDDYVDASIDAVHLVADLIDETKLADNSLDSEHYNDASIDLAHMSSVSVDSDNIVEGTILVGDMAANSIDSDQYVDGSIDTAHYTAASVDATAMGANSVDSSELVDGGVDLSHMSSASVDSDNIVDNTIANADMADNSIDSDDYVDDSIDEAHLNTGFILLPIRGAKLTGGCATNADAANATGPAIEGGEDSWALLIDDDADEGACWSFVMPETYNATTITLTIHYTMAGANTTDEITFEGAWCVHSDGEDLDTLGCDTLQTAGAVTVPDNAGVLDTATITFTSAQADDVVKGDLVQFQLSTDADGGAGVDDTVGDSEVRALILRW